jgi:hypothetical protein
MKNLLEKTEYSRISTAEEAQRRTEGEKGSGFTRSPQQARRERRSRRRNPAREDKCHF